MRSLTFNKLVAWLTVRRGKLVAWLTPTSYGVAPKNGDESQGGYVVCHVLLFSKNEKLIPKFQNEKLRKSLIDQNSKTKNYKRLDAASPMCQPYFSAAARP